MIAALRYRRPAACVAPALLFFLLTATALAGTKTYYPISRNPEACSYFANEENIAALETEKQKKFSTLENRRAPEAPDKPLGYLEETRTDIDNDGAVESVYQLGAVNDYFDGSLLIYFTDNDSRTGFINCILGNACPDKLPQEKRRDVDYLVKSVQDFWPGTKIISAASLERDISSLYEIRYTWLHPVSINGKTYIYFEPLNKEALAPSSAVAMLGPDKKMKTVCTYGGM